MAATQHGTAYVYGVDATYFTSAQVKSISLRRSDKNNDGVENNSGQLVSMRCDDQTDEITATLVIESAFTRKTVAAKVTFSSGDFAGDYRVTSTSEGKQNKGFVDYTVTLVKDEYLTLS